MQNHKNRIVFWLVCRPRDYRKRIQGSKYPSKNDGPKVAVWDGPKMGPKWKWSKITGHFCQMIYNHHIIWIQSLCHRPSDYLCINCLIILLSTSSSRICQLHMEMKGRS